MHLACSALVGHTILNTGLNGIYGLPDGPGKELSYAHPSVTRDSAGTSQTHRNQMRHWRVPAWTSPEGADGLPACRAAAGYGWGTGTSSLSGADTTRGVIAPTAPRERRPTQNDE